MDTNIITETARKTLAGTISFPEVAGQLLAAGVKYYDVDYAGLRKTFYSADGDAVVAIDMKVCRRSPPISTLRRFAQIFWTANETISHIATSPAGRGKPVRRVTSPSCVESESLTLAARATSIRNGFLGWAQSIAKIKYSPFRLLERVRSAEGSGGGMMSRRSCLLAAGLGAIAMPPTRRQKPAALFPMRLRKFCRPYNRPGS
jgi:hypothetical protein